ncbi:MAG: hypothetical protein M1120_00155 [Patescibacteria group bacterium]|nr:hypothetical protein [Patescibacteria group bacterium]
MKKKKLSQKFSQNLLRQLSFKQDEVSQLPPQTMGPLTPIYKKAASRLKVNPWKILIPISLILALLVLKMTGLFSVKLVSVLQQAF